MLNITTGNGLAVGAGLASALFGSAVYPSFLKPFGLILGLGVAGLGVADMMGFIRIGDILPFYERFNSGYASYSGGYRYPYQDYA